MMGATFFTDVGRDPLESHDGACTGLFSDASLVTMHQALPQWKGET